MRQWWMANRGGAEVTRYTFHYATTAVNVNIDSDDDGAEGEGVKGSGGGGNIDYIDGGGGGGNDGHRRLPCIDAYHHDTN